MPPQAFGCAEQAVAGQPYKKHALRTYQSTNPDPPIYPPSAMSLNPLSPTPAPASPFCPPQRNRPGILPVMPQNTQRVTTQLPPPGPLDIHTRHHHMKKRVNIIIAILNINGAYVSTVNLNLTDKWLRINTILQENKIVILAL